MEFPIIKPMGFVIYDPNTKLYSTGGERTKWSPTPKIWKKIGHLHNHLSYFGSDSTVYGRTLYTGKEVIYDIYSGEYIRTVGEAVKDLKVNKLLKEIRYYKRLNKLSENKYMNRLAQLQEKLDSLK